MNEFLDASVLLRYLLADLPTQTERARRLIDGGTPLLVTETVLLETAFTLTKFYKVPREQAVDTLIAFLQKRNLSVYHYSKTTIIAALLLCRPSGRVSFGDAFLWAAGYAAIPSVIYSFDQRFPSEEIDLREP